MSRDVEPRPVLLPDVTTFDPLFIYRGEWHRDDPHRPQIVAGRNELGPYCSVDTAAIGGKRHRAIDVHARQIVLDAIAPRLVTPDDRLSIKIIAHVDGRALVIVEHGYIIGSHWLAYIDPATIPAEGSWTGEYLFDDAIRAELGLGPVE